MKNNDPDNLHKNLYDVRTHASGPTGRLPLQPDFLTNAPSGNVFGWTQDAAMGWSPSDLGKDEYLILVCPSPIPRWRHRVRSLGSIWLGVPYAH